MPRAMPRKRGIGSVETADLQGNRARFRPTLSNYSLARLHAPFDERDVEVELTLEFTDVTSQGLGFYVRQNGGYLQQTPTHGQGYAVFVEGFRASPGIGAWREVDGNEQEVQVHFDPALNFQNGVRYRVRFRVRGNCTAARGSRATGIRAPYLNRRYPPH